MLHIDKVDSLQAEPIWIRALNLDEFQCYKLRLVIEHESGVHASYGIFRSDCLGVIDLNRDAPIRGTYHDIDGMGLFASLTPTVDFAFGRMTKCNGGQPWYYELQLFSPSDTLLDTIHLKKHWKHPLVTRIEVSAPNLHGTLYKPPGDGPFPCILDILGANGGIPLERPAAMFASEGFLVFTFLYYSSRIDDLPDYLTGVDVEYFEKPLNYILSLPYSNGKVGLYGMSMGGLLANFLATRHSQISAVIAINSSESFDSDMTLKQNGQLIPSCGVLDHSLNQFRNGVLDMSKKYHHLYKNVQKEHKIQFQNAPKSTAFRLVGALDDWVIQSVDSVRSMQKDIKEAGRKVEVQLYAGGHNMAEPYFPHHTVVWSKVLKVYWGLGGECYLHGASQMRVWKRNVQFFKEHLGATLEIGDWERETKIVVPRIGSRL